MEHESRQHKNQDFEHILFCVGEGSIRCTEIRRWFVNDQIHSIKESNSETKIKNQKKIQSLKKVTYKNDSRASIIVGDITNVKTRIAQCCTPFQRDSIRGYLTRERVITIHKEKCKFLEKLNPERMVKVYWELED